MNTVSLFLKENHSKEEDKGTTVGNHTASNTRRTKSVTTPTIGGLIYFVT
jgi:hypothetical protein